MERNLPPSEASEDPRSTLVDLAAAIRSQLLGQLLGLYLWGSLATGEFYPNRSDIDLVAVLEDELSAQQLDALRSLHGELEAARTEWRDRIEVVYISRAALASFASLPEGTIARISPGEPLHFRDLGGNLGWLLDWHGVLTAGETLFGPPPGDLGPSVEPDRFRTAVVRQLSDLSDEVRANSVAYVPAQQGYIVATVCRALYSLATGEQTSKQKALAWYAERSPEEAEYVWAAYRAYRADVRGPHARLIGFVDSAVAATESGLD